MAPSRAEISAARSTDPIRGNFHAKVPPFEPNLAPSPEIATLRAARPTLRAVRSSPRAARTTLRAARATNNNKNILKNNKILVC